MGRANKKQNKGKGSGTPQPNTNQPKQTEGLQVAGTSYAKKGEMARITYPGVQIKEVLELQEFFPTITQSLAVTLILMVIVAQLRVTTMAYTKPMGANTFSKLESVNNYIKKGLARSPEILEVAAAVAISKTLAVHADGRSIQEDADDLINNTSGPSNASMNLGGIINDPAQVRKMRRGLMLQLTGTVQATVMHNPRRIHQQVQAISSTNILQLLPFDTSDLSLEAITARIKELCGSEAPFHDGIIIAANESNSLELETLIGVSRKKPVDVPLAALELPANLDSLPAWQRKAIKRIAGGNA